MRAIFLFAVACFACCEASATTYLIETTGTVSSIQNPSETGLGAAHLGDPVKISFAVETDLMYSGTDGATYLEYVDFSPDLQGGIRSRVSVGGRPFNIDKYAQAEQLVAAMDNANYWTGPTQPPSDYFFVLEAKMQDAILLGVPATSTPIRQVTIALQAPGASKLVTGPPTNFARNVFPPAATQRTGVVLDGKLELQSTADGITYYGLSADTVQVNFSLDKVAIRRCRMPFAWLLSGAPWPSEVECD